MNMIKTHTGIVITREGEKRLKFCAIYSWEISGKAEQ